MKKLLKSADKKIVAVLLVIMLLLSTVAAYQIYATITNEEDSYGSEEDAPGDGRYYTVRDLKDMYDILCCYHGGDHSHLTGSYGATLYAGGSSTSVTDSGKEIGKLLKSDEGNETALTVTSTSSTSPYTDASYSADTYGYYHIASTEVARPMEAYILAEMIEEVDGGTVFYDDEYSAIQYAWWTTIAGSHGTIKTPNSLSDEAQAFENYIAKVANSTDPKDFVEQHYKFEKDGVIHEGDVPAPVIEFTPERDEDIDGDGIVDKLNGDKVETSWDSDTQTWTVGPFKINYVEESYSAGDRPDVDFSAITDAKLYTNLGEVPEDKWKFNFVEGERDTADTFEYPHNGELFYIELDFIPGATEITNLHFDFKYMNAGGKFDYLEGTYFRETWTPQSEVVETCSGPSGNETTCSHGNTSSHPIKWKYWLKLTGMEEDISQLLAYGIVGARWYTTTGLDLNDDDTPDYHHGSFAIKKVMVDENGNPLPNQDRNKKFKFEIYKDGSLYNIVWVSPNRPYYSPVYEWEDGEAAPVFTVNEVLEEGSKYKQYGDIEITGDLEENTLTFTAKNYADIHKGYVSITKTQLGAGLENKEFSFKLYVANNLYVEPGKTADDGIITVKVGETWTSNEIQWTGDAPKYKVVEVNLPEGAELINLVNDTGVLTDKGTKTANVIAINKSSLKGTLTVKKVAVEVPENTTLVDDTFKITIRVGENTYVKQLKVGQSWSETFTWNKPEEAPTYEVIETDLPKGWELVGIDNASGTLVANSNIEALVKNKPTEQSKTIQITKHTVSNSSTDDLFTIVTEIKGNFKYGDEEINGSKTITTELHAEEVATLGPIKWTGVAPTYEVKETKIPVGWVLQDITNNKGSLSDIDGEEIAVLCTNVADKEHSGSFEIHKQIVDKDGNVLENSNPNKEFTFEIYKDGALYNIVKASANKPYISPTYYWLDGQPAPVFTVLEKLDENGAYKQYGNIDITGNLEEKTLVFTAKNYSDQGGYISIEKKQLGTGLEGQEFSFKLYVNNNVYIESGKTADDGTIKIKVGETWTSNKIEWDTDTAPSYKVEEINLPEGTKLIGLENETGNLIKDETVKVVATNGPETHSATIKVEKQIAGNATTDESFSFTIRVGNDTFYKTLKAGQSWTETFVWEGGSEAPTYEVTETDIPEGWSVVEIKNGSGTLSDNTRVDIVAINEATEEHSGTIKIHKETISDDKEGVDENDDVFTFTTRISGTFELNGESIVNGSRTITSELKSGDTVEVATVTWKGDAPSYEVVETALPDGWKLKEITYNSGYFEKDKTIEVNCTNEYKIREEYDLTMEMAGMVWEDVALNPEDKNTEDSKPNGKYDAEAEQGIEKVEVVIWKKCYDASGNEIVSLRKEATGYEENSNVVIEFPLYTSADGVWTAPRMAVPGLLDEEKDAGAVKADYDVEFTYDGQTYTPTDFLVSGNVEHFRKATNAQKSQYLKDSMAYEVEEERQAFDDKFEIITGETPIDDDGVTNGYAVGTDGNSVDLLYYSTDSMPTVEGNTRKISELQTLDDGYIRDQYKMKSRTSTGGLTYPFDNKVHLENVKREIDKIEGGLIIRYKYSATYPYMLNVNLGLVRRDEAELALTKDVYSAAVAVNQKLLNYKFNEYVDFESEKYQDYLNLQLKVADANIAYKLDLYESDYYYRAKVYEENAAVLGALQDFYTSLGKSDLAEELDLDVFLTYKISIYNNSDSYLAKVRSVTDYFDEDLELVDTEVTKYVQEANGKVVDSVTTVATPAYIVKKGPTDSSMWEEQLKESLAGKVTADYSTKYTSSQDLNTVLSNNTAMATSDNVRSENTKSYYKANIDLNSDSYKLAVGEKLEVFLTFKVRTDEAPARFGDSVADAVNSYVRLGTKANVAEIESYTTYYHDKGTVAGKVDKDSAPNNVDIENKNDKAWYEDDADSAPIITLDLYHETRSVDGFAWEDEETEQIDYNQVIGNGMYDEGERLIGNLTTQMVEKVTVKQADGTYRDYDFVWPTHKGYDFLNGQTLEEITGYDSITLTSNSPENTGSYKFTNIPAGNYVVRFEYGNFPADDVDVNGKTIKLNGVPETKTSDDNSREPAVYNGQDFKTTAYEADIVKDDGRSDYASNDSGYIDEEWYDFSTAKYDENGNVTNHNSDVIDNEARRLEVIAYSRVLDNTITTVLASADDYNADHTELYENTSMFADTAKINLNIENMHSLKEQKVVITDEKSGQTVEVLAGDTETLNDLLTNTVIGKSDINGDKGTVGVINYNYKIEAIDAGLEERSNTEFVLDKEIESITVTTNSGEQILKAVYDISYEFEIDEATGKSTYTAKVELNADKSYGTSNLLAQNKDEDAGLQNFRYIYYDDSISQALNIEVIYRFTILNVGEVDRTGKVAEMTPDELLAAADAIKDQTYRKEGDKLVNIAHPQVGEYLGSIYYIGKRDGYTQDDTIVKTKARQLIDYVDNDTVFRAEENKALNSSWKSVTGDELLADKVIDSTLIEDVDGVNTILDDKGVAYTTTQRNNLALSVDAVEGEQLANPEFIVDLVPFAASEENSDTTSISCMSSMNMMMSRSIDSQIADDDLSYDNIAELVKLENTVGKRDIKTIAGNVDPKGGLLGEGEFAASLDERDSSATELITFTPPYGLDTRTSLTTEMLIVGIAALAILSAGVVLIKKYVIK